MIEPLITICFYHCGGGGEVYVYALDMGLPTLLYLFLFVIGLRIPLAGMLAGVIWGTQWILAYDSNAASYLWFGISEPLYPGFLGFSWLVLMLLAAILPMAVAIGIAKSR